MINLNGILPLLRFQQETQIMMKFLDGAVPRQPEPIDPVDRIDRIDTRINQIRKDHPEIPYGQASRIAEQQLFGK